MIRKSMRLFIICSICVVLCSSVHSWADNTIGSSGLGNGQFQNPTGIAVNANTGRIYVVDSLNHRVQIFDAQGNFISTFGSNGSGVGQFGLAVGITTDTAGNVYVVDMYTGFYWGRAQIFTKDGLYLTTLNGLTSPGGIDLDSDGNLYVAEAWNGLIKVLDSGGGVVRNIGNPASINKNEVFSSPMSVAVDSQKNVYIADYGNHRVQKFDASGAYLLSLGKVDGLGQPIAGTGDGEFVDPYSLEVDDEDNLYVLDRSQACVQKFKSDGTFVAKLLSTAGFDRPEGVEVIGKGYLFIADTFNHRVFLSTVPVESISVAGSPANVIASDGGTIQMTSSIVPKYASDQSVVWSVENGTGEAIIDASGILKAVKNGTVTVKATAHDGTNVVGSAIINITNQFVGTTAIVVHGAGSDVITTQGGTLQMQSETTPLDATDNTVLWSVENGSGQATIDGAGLLKAVRDGTVTVKATARDGTNVVGSCVVTISNQTPVNPNSGGETSITTPAAVETTTGTTTPSSIIAVEHEHERDKDRPRSTDIILDMTPYGLEADNNEIVEMRPGKVVVENLNGASKNKTADSELFEIKKVNVINRISGLQDIGVGGYSVVLRPRDLSNVDALMTYQALAGDQALYHITLDVSDGAMDVEPESLTAVGYLNGKMDSPVILGGFYDAQLKTFSFYTEDLGVFSLVRSQNIINALLDVDNKSLMLAGTKKMPISELQIHHNRAMVPLNFVMETLRIKTDLIKEERVIEFKDEKGKTLTMPLDYGDPGARPIGDTNELLVPLRYVAETFGCKVLWIPSSRQIVIVR